MRIVALCAVLLFGLAFAAGSYEDASSEIAKAVASKLQGKTVAILDLTDITGNVRELGRVLATQNLNVDLNNLGVQVVNRRQLDAILRELKLSQSGLVDAVLAKSSIKFTAADLTSDWKPEPSRRYLHDGS